MSNVNSISTSSDHAEIFVLKGSFEYSSLQGFSEAQTKLLLCLKVCRVKLTNLDSKELGGFFGRSGTLFFEVEGSESDMLSFKNALTIV